MELRHNNFDLLRFLLAFSVFLYHAYVLSGTPALSIMSTFFSAEIAVKSFFVVSGFLIFMSYENSRDARSYLLKRVRRIYPAYCFIILACGTLGVIFSAYAWNDYFSSHFLKYIAANLLFLNFAQTSLPGLFEGNRVNAVNGALWTLKIEVMFYLLVPLAVMAFRRFGRPLILIALYASSVIYVMAMQRLIDQTGSGIYVELQKQLPGQIAFFIAGAAGYYYLEFLTKHIAWLLTLAVTAFALQSWLPWKLVQPAALAVLIVSFACIVPFLGNFNKYGDFSYGIYIVHFPVLQVLIAYNLFTKAPWATLFVAIALVMMAAFFLWRFVEKPFLRKASHYVAVHQK